MTSLEHSDELRLDASLEALACAGDAILTAVATIGGLLAEATAGEHRRA